MWCDAPRRNSRRGASCHKQLENDRHAPPPPDRCDVRNHRTELLNRACAALARTTGAAAAVLDSVVANDRATRCSPAGRCRQAVRASVDASRRSVFWCSDVVVARTIACRLASPCSRRTDARVRIRSDTSRVSASAGRTECFRAGSRSVATSHTRPILVNGRASHSSQRRCDRCCCSRADHSRRAAGSAKRGPVVATRRCRSLRALASHSSR